MITIKQQLQLKYVEQMAINNDNWDEIYSQMYSWLPADSTTSLSPLVNW
jgi:hypothetical protein